MRELEEVKSKPLERKRLRENEGEKVSQILKANNNKQLFTRP